MDTVKLFITGIIAVAVVTAFGIHAKDLKDLVTNTGGAGQKLLSAAIQPGK